MKTLTITDAKKNLGHWLAAATRGEDIGIIVGSDIIALRKVGVESTDYAQREYGATQEQIIALEDAAESIPVILRCVSVINLSTDSATPCIFARYKELCSP